MGKITVDLFTKVRRLMRSIKVVFLKLFDLILVVVVLSIVFSIVARPAYDEIHLKYQTLAAYFERTRTQLESSQISLVTPLGVGGLNGGDWTTVCVFGGYTRPSGRMRDLGARVGLIDSLRWLQASASRLRWFDVEEEEIAVAFVDRKNLAHFIHFENGIGPDGQHLEECISRPETKIDLMRQNYRPPTTETPASR